ncbi:MAG: Outer rane receptor protein, mostly Fe transport [Bacteroidetes bacterium]|nr:Outer rane receptor protein, mostly Fe transport [Bacteroidota bacterium]
MTSHVKAIVRCAVALSLLLSSSLPAWGGTTGNIKGKVTDLTTGESLLMVNVLVVGSGRGAVTNDKGEYSITGVTPGVYALRASLLGYRTIEAKKVTINADETTVLDFKLASTLIEKEGVTVEGQPPMVDVKKTAGDQTFNKDKIEQLPNLKGVEDVLGLQAGVVKFGNQLFLRGGRANETSILIDGVVVNDVSGSSGPAGTSTANEQLQQLYSGNATGGGALSVAANAIQSVSVSSSGLDAEYGNAQSGVVNITTKSGSEIFSGTAQYRTDAIGSSGFGERYYAANIGGPEPITSYLLPSLGVEFPGKMSFFMSSNFNQADGPYSYSTQQFYNPLKRKVKFAGFWGSLLNGLGFTYTDKQSNDFSFNTKVSYVIGDNDQFAFSYRANTSSARPLSGGYSWRDRYDSSRTNTNLTTQNVMQWTHILGTNSLLKGYVSRLETDKSSNVAGLPPDRYSAVTNYATLYYRDQNYDGFNDIGSDQGWSQNNTVIWSVKFDFNSQIHPLHFLKTGFEYNYEHIQSTVISYPLLSPDPTSPGFDTTRGDYPGYGLARWVSNNLPSRGALYVQDNIEFSSINIKIGLRYDFFYLGKQVFADDFVQQYELVTNNPNDKKEPADWLENESFFSQLVRGYVSPRLAIGYPVSARTVFYFNYGHFLQYPEREQLFRYPIITQLSGNFIGNPSLKPQKTIQYEAGFDQLIFDDLSLGIRGYYKDIFDYVAFRRIRLKNRKEFDKYVNLDYASTRGFEIILNKGLSYHYSGSLGYTFQLAKGRASDPFAVQANPNLFGLPRETRLDYDQQHTVNVFLGYRVGPKEDYEVFGIPLNNWGASVTWNFGSGFPYTPFNLARSGNLEDAYLKNTGDGPYTSEVNISFFKGFNFLDNLNVTFTLDVTNLLNRRNVDLNGGGFNSLTGRPIAYGDFVPTNPKNIYSWSGARSEGIRGGEAFDSRVPPFIFRAPRQISLGMKVNWN